MDVMVICEDCKQAMLHESTMNNRSKLFVCPFCKGEIKVIDINIAKEENE